MIGLIVDCGRLPCSAAKKEKIFHFFAGHRCGKTKQTISSSPRAFIYENAEKRDWFCLHELFFPFTFKLSCFAVAYSFFSFSLWRLPAGPSPAACFIDFINSAIVGYWLFAMPPRKREVRVNQLKKEEKDGSEVKVELICVRWDGNL